MLDEYGCEMRREVELDVAGGIVGCKRRGGTEEGEGLDSSEGEEGWDVRRQRKSLQVEGGEERGEISLSSQGRLEKRRKDVEDEGSRLTRSGQNNRVNLSTPSISMCS